MLKREMMEASRLAREAGRILLEVYATDFAVSYKGVADPVTEADKRANDYLVDALRSLFPDDNIVAEESKNRSFTSTDRCWYVDPLDGTKEFIAKNDEFSVMIGLAIGGEAKVGVVYQPVREKLYRGIVGEGAFLEEGGRTQALSVSERRSPEELRLVVSRSHRNRYADLFKERTGIANETRTGSVGLKVGLIAEQQADVYVHITDRSSLWDACAPEAILRAAGGRFTRLNGEPHRYGLDELRNLGGILASNAVAYDSVLPAARTIAAEAGIDSASR